MAPSLDRSVFAAAVILAWALVPYGVWTPLPDEAAPVTAHLTFASLSVGLVDEALGRNVATVAEAASAVLLALLGVATGLSTAYPALLALPAESRRRCAAWPRWLWVALGVAVILGALAGHVMARSSTAVPLAGLTAPVLTIVAYLLPGLAAAAGLATIGLGLSRRAWASWLGRPYVVSVRHGIGPGAADAGTTA